MAVFFKNIIIFKKIKKSEIVINHAHISFFHKGRKDSTRVGHKYSPGWKLELMIMMSR